MNMSNKKLLFDTASSTTSPFCRGRSGRSDSEDLLLLRLELLVGDDSLRLQLRQLLELRGVVGLSRLSGCSCRLLLGHRLVVGRLVLRGVLLVLPVADRPGRPGDDGRRR